MISFGAKIQVAECQIQRKDKNEFIKVPIYEYTCEDDEDVRFFRNNVKEQDWEYGRYINEIVLDNRMRHMHEIEHHKRVFAMEDDNGETINVCTTEVYPTTNEISFIETSKESRKKYKFSGLTMLGFLAKQLQAEKKCHLVLQNAVTSALKYYTGQCHFLFVGGPVNEDNEVNMFQEASQLDSLIRTAEGKSGATINLIA